MGFLGFYSLIGIIHVVTCQSAAFKERQFSKKTGVLYQSPYSWPEMTSCSGRSCTAFSCAKACQEEDGCVVFSHNEANATCILSRRPDYDPANHEIIHLEWNTYYTGKLCSWVWSLTKKTETGCDNGLFCFCEFVVVVVYLFWVEHKWYMQHKNIQRERETETETETERHTHTFPHEHRLLQKLSIK